jgi:tetratricopeptide (TPR) repeat protein/transcriptional regulator with XRE-family HTH domain
MTTPSPKKGGPGVRVNVQEIRDARLRKSWSQDDLAKKIKCHKRVIERIESRGTAAIDSVKKLSDALDIPIESIRVTSPEPAAFSRGLFQLPPSLVDFTGREAELERIAARLRGVGGVVGVSSALRGMGGIGKTATAIKACEMVKEHFPDAQLVVELRGMSERPMTAVEAMTRIVRDFHPETGKLPDNETELLPLYRKVLAGKKALILLDDAKDETQVKSLLSVPSPMAFVVTSRAALALDGVVSIPLDVLPPDKALELLREIVDTKGTDDELREVAKLCGFLPLALRVAADFVRLHRNWTVPKYTDALKDEARRWEHLKGKTHDRDVEAVLALSTRELVLDNPERAERWQMLSVFPADFDVRAVAAVWDLKGGEELDEATTLDELTALLDQSLVQFDESTARYSLHDLFRPIARDTFEFVENHPLQAGSVERIDTAERRFAGYYRDVLAAADDLYLKGHEGVLAGLQLFDLEQANIRHGQAWASRNRSFDRSATELCGNYPVTGIYVLTLRLSLREQIQWLEEAITACREIGDRRGEGKALGSLGIAWADLGDTRKAITLFEQHLAISREIGDRQGEGAALGNLGNAWALLGDTRKAITFQEQHLAISREIGDRRGEGTVLGNLGQAWADLGDTRKAITFHEQSLVIKREIGNRRGEANSSYAMAVALHKLGQTPEALRHAEHGLKIYTEIEDPWAENVRQLLAKLRREN